MSADDGFVDLRLNRQEGQVNESFWPSFTDIMTVIVMIFLIAMVVLMIRNMELVTQLRATMEAERAAAELARSTGREKDTLNLQLLGAEDQISRMQLELLRAREQNQRLDDVISRQKNSISTLTSEADDLKNQRSQLQLQTQRLEADLERKQSTLDRRLALLERTQADLKRSQEELQRKEQDLTIAERDLQSLELDLSTLQSRYQENQQELDNLQLTVNQQQQQLQQVDSSRQEIDRRYMVLVGEYDDLKVKYDKLIRPARSPKGRHLVEVRYWKEGNSYRLSWREGSEAPFQSISRSALDKILTRLMAEKQPNGLYVRVIFPESSRLSYSEAWELTSHLHNNYDYYSQIEGNSEEPDLNRQPAE